MTYENKGWVSILAMEEVSGEGVQLPWKGEPESRFRDQHRGGPLAGGGGCVKSKTEGADDLEDCREVGFAVGKHLLTEFFG